MIWIITLLFLHVICLHIFKHSTSKNAAGGFQPKSLQKGIPFDVFSGFLLTFSSLLSLREANLSSLTAYSSPVGNCMIWGRGGQGKEGGSVTFVHFILLNVW